MRRSILIALLLCAARAAPAESLNRPEVQLLPARPRSWPLSIAATLLIGVEPQPQANGASPIAFGIGGEFLWRARVGGFVSLLASEGTLVLVTQVVNGTKVPSLPDRISVPFGFAVRPFTFLVGDREEYWARLLAGVGAQLGVAVENLRTSDDSQTVAGLHLALSLDVPLWGGPVQGGAGLRLMGRAMFTPSVTLSANSVAEPVSSGQFYAGFCWWP
jgi:hypothetical protein